MSDMTDNSSLLFNSNTSSGNNVATNEPVTNKRLLAHLHPKSTSSTSSLLSLAVNSITAQMINGAVMETAPARGQQTSNLLIKSLKRRGFEMQKCSSTNNILLRASNQNSTNNNASANQTGNGIPPPPPAFIFSTNDSNRYGQRISLSPIEKKMATSSASVSRIISSNVVSKNFIGLGDPMHLYDQEVEVGSGDSKILVISSHQTQANETQER